MNERPPLSLYLHIPFCRHRCAYCDFNTYSSLGDLKVPYARALSEEVRLVAGDARRPAVTIFFGGGTPSLMATAQLAEILTSVRVGFDLTPGAEITLEANPDTVDGDYLAAAAELGVNRISYGAQSANEDELRLLEREHDFAAVERAVRLSRAAGYRNLNLDLIYGLPGQDLTTWERSLRAALALAPEHLSLYCLTIEAGTPMARWLKSGRIAAPDADVAAEQYELACTLLEEAGYGHYEISNWARPGFECRHNLAYWRDAEYLGFGAGAHGHAAGTRYANVRQPRAYMRRLAGAAPRAYPLSPAAAESHRLDRREAMADRIITQLRLLTEGLDLEGFAASFGANLTDAFPGTVEQLTEWDLLRQEGDRLYLSRRGWFLSNQVFYRFM